MFDLLSLFYQVVLHSTDSVQAFKRTSCLFNCGNRCLFRGQLSKWENLRRREFCTIWGPIAPTQYKRSGLSEVVFSEHDVTDCMLLVEGYTVAGEDAAGR